MSIRPDTKVQASLDPISPAARSKGFGQFGGLSGLALSPSPQGQGSAKSGFGQLLLPSTDTPPPRAKPRRDQATERPQAGRSQTQGRDRAESRRSRAQESDQRRAERKAKEDRREVEQPSSGHPEAQLTAFGPQLSTFQPEQRNSQRSSQSINHSPQPSPFSEANGTGRFATMAPAMITGEGQQPWQGSSVGLGQQLDSHYQLTMAGRLQQAGRPIGLPLNLPGFGSNLANSSSVSPTFSPTFSPAFGPTFGPRSSSLGSFGQSLHPHLSQSLAQGLNQGLAMPAGLMAGEAMAQIRQLFGAELPKGGVDLAGVQLSSIITTQTEGSQPGFGEEAGDPLAQQIRHLLATADDSQGAQLSSTGQQSQNESLEQEGLAKIVASQRFNSASAAAQDTAHSSQATPASPALNSLANQNLAEQLGQNQATNPELAVKGQGASAHQAFASSLPLVAASAPSEQMAPSALAQQLEPFGSPQSFGSSAGSSFGQQGFGEGTNQGGNQSQGQSQGQSLGGNPSQGQTLGMTHRAQGQPTLGGGLTEAPGLSPTAGPSAQAAGQQPRLQDLSGTGTTSAGGSAPTELSPTIRQAILSHSVRLAAGGGSAEVTVQTGSSGPLGIKVAIGGGTVDIQLATADDELSQTLSDESPMLMDALRRQLPGQEIALRVNPPEEAMEFVEFADQQDSRDSRQFSSDDNSQLDSRANQTGSQGGPGNQSSGSQRQAEQQERQGARQQGGKEPAQAGPNPSRAAEPLASRYSSTGRDLAGRGAKGTLARQLI